jgi:hypothetical protein
MEVFSEELTSGTQDVVLKTEGLTRGKLGEKQ